MFSVALFDLDGTLLNTIDDLAAAGNYTLAQLGFSPHPVQAYKRFVGSGLLQLMARMLPEGHRDDATAARAAGLFKPYYAQHMNDATAPYPGILDALARLRLAGVRLGVVSNKEDAQVQPLVERHFPNTFDGAVGKCPRFGVKPDPQSLLWLLAQLGGAPAATLYVGDSDVDILTAKNAGVLSCGVLWGFRGEEELRRAGADYLAPDANRLEDIVLLGPPTPGPG